MELPLRLLEGDATVLPGALAEQNKDEPRLSPGDIVGAYRVEALAGEGGMGRVYKAVHQKLERTVALKVLRAGLAEDKTTIRRFFDEARAVNRINHPNIIEVTDFLEPDDGPTCYVMEYLEGHTLTEVLTGEPMPVARVLRLATQMCKALCAAHEAGILHRDLKPDNVFITARGDQRDVVKILDFGVAHLEEQGAEDKKSIIGTPSYMAPEQLVGRAVDHRSDIFSFGVLLYEMVSGTRYAQGKNASALLLEYARDTPKLAPLPKARDLPDGLVALVDACLARAPDGRPANMTKVRDALVALSGAREISRPRWWWAAALLPILVLAAVALWPGPTEQPPVVNDVLPNATADAEVVVEGAVFFSSQPAGAEVFAADNPAVVLCTTPCSLSIPPEDAVDFVFVRGPQRIAVTASTHTGAVVQATFPEPAKAEQKQAAVPPAATARAERKAKPPAVKRRPGRASKQKKKRAKKKKKPRTVIFDPFAG